MIRILIADDHTIMREGLRRILEDIEDVEVVGEVSNGQEVLERVRRGGIDQILLDLSMPGGSGTELIRQIRIEAPDAHILVLTMHDEAQYALRTLRAGAQGFLTKECAASQLLYAIRRLASGHPYISVEMAEQFAKNLIAPSEVLPHGRLSDCEFEIFALLVSGQTISEIAKSLRLSAKAVSTHKTHIYEKTGMNTIYEMVSYAVANRLIADFER